MEDCVFRNAPDPVSYTGESENSCRYSMRQIRASEGFNSNVPVTSFNVCAAPVVKPDGSSYHSNRGDPREPLARLQLCIAGNPLPMHLAPERRIHAVIIVGHD